MCESLVRSYEKHVRVFGEKTLDEILVSKVDRKVKDDFSEKIQKLIEQENIALG